MKNIFTNITDKFIIYLSIGFIMMCGALLRLYNITQNSFWIDEMATIHFSTGSFIDIWNYTANGEFNPPLFYWLESIIIHYFGVSELSMRFIPAIAGILTIPLMYFIIKKFTQDNFVGILGSSLMAFSIFMVYYAQEARAYTLALLFYMIALYYYIDFINTYDTKYIRYVLIFSILAVYTHFYAAIGILIFIFHIAYIQKFVLFIVKDFIRFELPWLAASFAIMLPLITVTIDLFKSRTGMGVDWGADAYFLISNIFIQSSGYSVYICIVFMCLALIGLLFYVNNTVDALPIFNNKRSKQIFLILGFAVPIISTLILANMISMSVRYLIYIVPYFYLCISLILMPLSNSLKLPMKCNQKLIIILLLFILIFGAAFINFSPLMTFHTQVTKADYKGAALYLNENICENDIIILLPEERKTAFNYYFKTNNIVYYVNKYNVTNIENIINDNKYKQVYIVQVVVAEYVSETAEINILLSKYNKKQFFAINIYNITPQIKMDG